jgi:hypothetical protein
MGPPQGQGDPMLMSLMQQLGQATQQGPQMPEMPIPQTASPFQRLMAAMGAGAGMGGDLGARRTSHLLAAGIRGQDQRADMARRQNAMMQYEAQKLGFQQKASMADLLMKEQQKKREESGRNRRFDIGEGGKMQRHYDNIFEARNKQAITEQGMWDRLGVIEGGKDKRFFAGESGRDRRTLQMIDAANKRHEQRMGLDRERLDFTKDIDMKKYEHSLDRLALDRQRLTNDEKFRAATLRKDTQKEVKRLVAQYPNAFTGTGFDPNTGTLMEAAKIVADSGLALPVGSKLPSALGTQLGDMEAGILSIQRARELYESLGRPSGFWAGTTPRRFRSEEAKEWDAYITSIVIPVRKALSGTAFTETERKDAMGMYPSIDSDPVTTLKALDALEDMIFGRYEQTVSVLDRGNYDMSKFMSGPILGGSQGFTVDDSWLGR